MNETNSGAQTTAIVPKAPEALELKEQQELEIKSGELVEKLEGGKNRELVRQLENLGADAQAGAARETELLKVRVGEMMKQIDGKGSAIPNGMVKLRMTLDEINPHVLSQPGKFGRLLGKTPAIGKILKKIAIKYESVQTQIDAIVANLRAGGEMLEKDNISLDQLYEQVKQHQLAVQKNAYLGELILNKLVEKLVTSSPEEKPKLEAVQHAVAMRVQDLRTMEQVNYQFFVSIDMTIDNNRLLKQSVGRTITVTTGLLTVGLAIQAALSRQKQVLEATKATQEYAADLLQANAAAIRRQSAEIGDLYTNPVLALDKVKKAHDDLLAAIEETEAVKRKGVEKANEGIKALTEMSRTMSQKAGALRPEDKEGTAAPSLEA